MAQWYYWVSTLGLGFLFLFCRSVCVCVCVCVLVMQSCPSLCNPMECRPPGSSVHGVLQAGILEWGAIPFSRGSSQPGYWTRVSCIEGKLFTSWATRETHIIHIYIYIYIIFFSVIWQLNLILSDTLAVQSSPWVILPKQSFSPCTVKIRIMWGWEAQGLGPSLLVFYIVVGFWPDPWSCL